MKKQIAVIVFVLVAWFVPVFVWGMSVGRKVGRADTWVDYETGFAHGRRSQHDYKAEFQTSEFQTRDTFGDKLLKTLCKRDGIDYDNGSFVFTCPKCTEGGARIQQSPMGSVYYGFHTAYPELEKLAPGESAVIGADHSETYCAKCLYPVGTDWKIIDLNPDPNNAGITITNGTRDRVTITYLDANDTWVTTDCNSADPNG